MMLDSISDVDKDDVFSGVLIVLIKLHLRQELYSINHLPH